MFVGKHLVDALVVGVAPTSPCSTGAGPRASCPTRSSASSPTAPTSRRCARRSPAATWDAVFDVSGFVMAAGGSDIDGLLDLLDGHVGAYVYTSSIMAYDQSWVGVFPWTEDQPTNPDGPTSYGGFKALAEASILARHAATGFPGLDRPAGGDLRAGQQHLRHGTADVPAAAPAPTDPRAARRARRRVVRPRRRSVRRDDRRRDHAGRGRRGVQRLGRLGRREPLHRRARRRRRGRGRRRRTCPTTCCAEIAAPGSPPVFSHLFGARHHAALDIGKAAATPRRTVATTCAAGHEHTYDVVPRARARPARGGRSSIRSGRRRGTSTPRPRSRSGSVAEHRAARV